MQYDCRQLKWWDFYLVDIDEIFKIVCKGVIVAITIFVVVNDVTHENFSFARLTFTSSFQAFCLKNLFVQRVFYRSENWTVFGYVHFESELNLPWKGLAQKEKSSIHHCGQVLSTWAKVDLIVLLARKEKC